VRDCVLGHKINALNVHIESLVPHIGIRLVRVGFVANPGVIEKDVYASVLTEGAFYGLYAVGSLETSLTR
jgi:hypothetical protein